MEAKATQAGSNTPQDADVSRLIRSEVDRWAPRRVPGWAEFLDRAAGVGPSPWLIYSAASAVLVVILLTAFIVGSALQLGALAPQAVPTNLH